MATPDFAQLERSIVLEEMAFERQVAGPKRMAIAVHRGGLAIRLSFELRSVDSGDEILASST